jgi:hypothetical protein
MYSFNPNTPVAFVPQTVTATDVGQWFETITQREGAVTVDAVLHDARNPKHFAHGLFEWNDTKAAEAFRRGQARHLIGILMVTPVKTAKQVVVTVRAWPKVSGGYTPAQVVAASPTKAVDVLDSIDRDIRALHAKAQAWESYLRRSKASPVVKAVAAYVKANPKP